VAVAAEDRIGTELAGYRIERVLGRGGMSVVYLAHDRRLKRNVALKLLAPELAQDDSFRARLLRESQLAASLDHPNVVPVYEAGEAQGLLYIAMRYVLGSDLKALLRAEGALAPERALALVEQVATALDAAHERGLVHRDVKPSNVLLTGPAGQEHCYLADFGLSTSASDRSAADAGQILGTIDYVAPEQIRGGEVDGRADVYSLACLLYESLVGEVPFRRASDVAVIYAHLEEPPPKASERAPMLPPAMDAVLERGTAKRPDERWQTCAALMEAARSAVGGVATVRVRRPSRRLGGAAALTGVAAAAAAVALILARGGGGTAIAPSDSLVRIDPAGGRLAAGVAVGARPTAVTVCGGSVWVTTRTGTVFEIEPKTLAPHQVDVKGTPTDVANVGDLAAVVSGPPERVTMIDSEFGQISNVVEVRAGHASATAVAFGRDVWIANPSGRRLERLDPPYTAVAATVPLPGSPRLLARGEGAIWAVGGRTLWRIDPSGHRPVATFRLLFAPRAIDAGSGGVWLVDPTRDAVVRVDPANGRPIKSVAVGHAPNALAVGADAVWVANRTDGTVSRIDPHRNTVDGSIRVGGKPVDLVAGLGAVWVVRQTA
jgi:DNA-binding beta-propeller fold protein YncE/predicted Ser/Thr protein kinase